MVGNSSSGANRQLLGSESPDPVGVDDAIAHANQAIDGIGQTSGLSGPWDTAVQEPGASARNSASIAPYADPIVTFPPVTTAVHRAASLHPLQEWEGYVVDIQGDEFVARLIDLTAGHSHESQEAVIPMAELSDRDASRLAVGGIFRWVIGYRVSPEGTRMRVSQVVFRDLPRVTADDLRAGEDWANAMATALNS